MPRLTVLRPDTPVGLDRFAGWMDVDARVLDLWEDPVPSLDACGDAIIVLGGRHNALDDTLGWQRPLRALLRGAVERALPVLGICLGHQVLARALGGEVTVADERGGEHGARTLTWAEKAADDPVLGPAAGMGEGVVAMSHYDVVTRLPDGAVELATTSKYRNQAFRYGSAVGVQFHPEATPERKAQWATNRGHDAGAMLEEMRAVDADVARLGEAIARAFAAQLAS
ncbi:MAG: type 1 glutamine amidotransferase [Propionibacterium sp.]|nr:type 1 glutamine amidotransferase [Propionibacterium sp.]